MSYLRLLLGLSLAFVFNIGIAQFTTTWDGGPSAAFVNGWASCSVDALPSAGLCLASEGGALTLFEEGAPLQNYSVTSEIVIQDSAAGAALIARASEDKNNLYQLELIQTEGQKVWQFVKREGGNWSLLERGEFDYQTGVPYLLRFSVVGNTLTGEVSPSAAEPTWTVLGSAQDDSLTQGRAGLKLISGTVAFGDVAVSELSASEIVDTAADRPETTDDGLLDLSTFDNPEDASSEAQTQSSAAGAGNTQVLDAVSARVTPATANQDLLDGDLFVSPDGSNDNSGSQEAPFASVQRCADAVQAGQRCVLRAGTYRETVTPPTSGTEGAPIVFTNYPGERPVISGADLVSGFAAEGDQQKASVDWDLGIGKNQLFINGQMQPEARWPNLGGDISRPQKATIIAAEERDRKNYVAELDATPPSGVEGARTNIGLGNLPNGHVWLYDSAVVQAVEGNRVTITSVDEDQDDLYRPIDPDNDLFIWGKRELIDEAGEWYLDPGAQSLYLAHSDVQNTPLS